MNSSPIVLCLMSVMHLVFIYVCSARPLFTILRIVMANINFSGMLSMWSGLIACLSFSLFFGEQWACYEQTEHVYNTICHPLSLSLSLALSPFLDRKIPSKIKTKIKEKKNEKRQICVQQCHIMWEVHRSYYFK